MIVMGKARIKMKDMRSLVKTTVFSEAQWWWCFLTSSPTSCPWSSMAVWLQMLPLKEQWNVYSIKEERYPHFHSFLTQFCECKTANPDRFVRRVISKLTIIIKNFKSMRQKMSVLEMTFRRLTLVSLHFEAIRFHTAQYFSRQGWGHSWQSPWSWGQSTPLWWPGATPRGRGLTCWRGPCWPGCSPAHPGWPAAAS